jgi:hypothetical protein
MIAYYHAVREAARRIAGATDRTVVMLRQGRVEQEPAMTDRMLGAIEEALTNFTVHGIRWSAKTLTDRGRRSQESRYGADFLGVLSITLTEFSISKGFLAQAKLLNRGRVNDLAQLRRQCDRMLDFTPDSFVFVYSNHGIRIVPAISVVAAETDPVSLYSRSSQRFFEEHLECFIGDRTIQSATPAALEALRQRFEARNALLLHGEPVDPRQLSLSPITES